MEKNNTILFDSIDQENLFNQWHPDVKKYTSDLDTNCALQVIKTTEESTFNILKYKEVLNLTNTRECKEILTRIVKEKDTTNFLKILKERDSLHPRYIERGYSVEEIFQLTEKDNYHPVLFLELNKKYYIIDGRTRFYCCLFLNKDVKVRIISDTKLNEKCKVYNQMEYIKEFYGALPVIKLPIKETAELKHFKMFYDLKQDSEKLGILHIKKEDLLFRETLELPRIMREFFTYYRDIAPDVVHKHPLYNSIIKVIPKIVGLLKEYLKEDNFKEPLCVHWNPIFRKWDIHPGFGRQVVLDLFDERETYECIAFNTGGHRVFFHKEFEKYNELEEHFKGRNVQFSVSANHGSLIPHVHLNAERDKMQTFFAKNYEETKNFLHNHKIITNFNFNRWTGYKQVSTDQYSKTVKLFLSDLSEKNRIKATLLALTGEEVNYKNGLIKITHKNISAL